MFYKFFVGCKNPQQKAKKEQEEDHKRNQRPDGDVVNVLKYVVIHKMGIN